MLSLTKRRFVDFVNLIFLIISIQLVNTCHGAVEVSLKLVYFSNPGHRLRTGRCCESSCEPCHYEFDVCFSREASSPYTPHGERHCDYGMRHTGEVDVDDDEYAFYLPSSFENGQRNPIKIAVPNWEGGVRVSIEVKDADTYWGWNQDNLIMEYTLPLNNPRPARSETACGWSPYVLVRGRTRMYIKYKMYCLQDYYGHNCRTYCRQPMYRSDRYTCDHDTGLRICHANYYAGCSVYCKPPHIWFEHYTCDPATGRRVCHRGYFGYYCQYRYVTRTPTTLGSTTSPPSPTTLRQTTDEVTPQTATSTKMMTLSDSSTSLTTAETPTTASSSTSQDATSTPRTKLFDSLTSLTTAETPTTASSSTYQDATLTPMTKLSDSSTSLTTTEKPTTTMKSAIVTTDDGSQTTEDVSSTKTSIPTEDSSRSTLTTPMTTSTSSSTTIETPTDFYTHTSISTEDLSTSTPSLGTSTSLPSSETPEQTPVVISTIKDTSTTSPSPTTGMTTWTKTIRRSPSLLDRSEKPSLSDKMKVTTEMPITALASSVQSNTSGSTVATEAPSDSTSVIPVNTLAKITSKSKASPTGTTLSAAYSTLSSQTLVTSEENQNQTASSPKTPVKKVPSTKKPKKTVPQTEAIPSTRITTLSKSSLTLSTLLSTTSVQNSTSAYSSHPTVTSSTGLVTESTQTQTAAPTYTMYPSSLSTTPLTLATLLSTSRSVQKGTSAYSSSPIVTSETEFTTPFQTELVTSSKTEYSTSQTELVTSAQSEYVTSQTEFTTPLRTGLVTSSQTEHSTSQTELVTSFQSEYVTSQTEFTTPSQTEIVTSEYVSAQTDLFTPSEPGMSSLTPSPTTRSFSNESSTSKVSYTSLPTTESYKQSPPMADIRFPVQSSRTPCWILNVPEEELQCNCTAPPTLPDPFPWINMIDMNIT